MVLDEERNCVFFAEYRNKGRTKLLCLCADGVPVAVQIWRGKEFAAFLVELDDGRPVVRGQKDLSPEQMERLAAALAELASIEAVIRDSERDWKAQLTEWWSRHDNALRNISALSIADGEKQAQNRILQETFRRAARRPRQAARPVPNGRKRSGSPQAVMHRQRDADSRRYTEISTRLPSTETGH